MAEEGAPETAPPASRTGWLALAVFLAAFLCYRLPAIPLHANAGDNLWSVPTALSLIHEGNLDLDEFRAPVGEMPAVEVWITDMARDPRLFRRDGRTFNRYPVGTALASLPVVAVAEIAAAGTGNSVRRSLQLAGLTASLIAAATCALLFLVAVALTGRHGTAAVLAAVFAFATPHFATHHNALWSHNTVLPFLLLALWLIPFRRARHVGWAAIPLGCAYFIRPDASLTILLFTVYVLLFHRSAFPRYALIGGLFVAAFLAHAHAVYGVWLPPYYQGRLETALFLEASAGHLVSPNRGLLVFTPLFLFSIQGAVAAVRRGNRFYAFLGLLLLVHWLTISAWPCWWAGHSYGARLFSPQLPVLTLLLIPAWEDCRLRGRKARRAIAVMALACLAWSGFVQWRGVTDQRVHDWNANPEVDLNPGNVWSWNDLQILRGFDPGGMLPKRRPPLPIGTSLDANAPEAAFEGWDPPVSHPQGKRWLRWSAGGRAVIRFRLGAADADTGDLALSFVAKAKGDLAAAVLINGRRLGEASLASENRELVFSIPAGILRHDAVNEIAFEPAGADPSRAPASGEGSAGDRSLRLQSWSIARGGR